MLNRELPRYKCHKEVWALKIAAITLKTDRDPYGIDPFSYGAVITPADDGYAPLEVTAEYMIKHNPQVGGYYVQYQDGYKSYSPAETFEAGYTRIY